MIFHIVGQFLLLPLLPHHQIVLPVDHLLFHLQRKTLLLFLYIFRVKQQEKIDEKQQNNTHTPPKQRMEARLLNGKPRQEPDAA